MQIQNVNWSTLVISLLGAVKLIAETFGYHIITNDQINAIANLSAVVVTILGVFLTHTKAPAVQTPTPPNPTPQKQNTPPSAP